jgi:drug/metabolite transporter (DMT)-like permease
MPRFAGPLSTSMGALASVQAHEFLELVRRLDLDGFDRWLAQAQFSRRQPAGAFGCWICLWRHDPSLHARLYIVALLTWVVLPSLAFSLWSLLLKHNRVSTITAFNFMVPIFCVVLSALFLGESIFSLTNAIALVLVSLGI